jgi:hypothetical protein
MSAQSLLILPSPPAGRESSFRIIFASSEDKPVVALQWDLLLPEGVTLQAISAGEAAESVHKSVTCSKVTPERKNDTVSQQHRCILAGGLTPLPDGSVAAVTCKLPAGLREATVRLKKVVGVSRDAKPIDIEEAEGTITVR